MEQCKICKVKNNLNYSLLCVGPDSKEYCAPCLRKVWPPYMTIMRFPKAEDNNLYNIEVGKYENVNNINIFSMCGWETRMVQILSTGVEVYHLEYFGEYRCPRNLDYFGKQSGDYCTADACKVMIDKRPILSRAYPKEKSIYLTWKYGGTPTC